MLIVDIKHKIGLDGFSEQDLPYQCPHCKTELLMDNAIGFGEYTKGCVEIINETKSINWGRV